MENILPRREARENAFLLAFSQTFGDIPVEAKKLCKVRKFKDFYISFLCSPTTVSTWDDTS